MTYDNFTKTPEDILKEMGYDPVKLEHMPRDKNIRMVNTNNPFTIPYFTWALSAKNNYPVKDAFTKALEIATDDCYDTSIPYGDTNEKAYIKLRETTCTQAEEETVTTLNGNRYFIHKNTNLNLQRLFHLLHEWRHLSDIQQHSEHNFRTKETDSDIYALKDFENLEPDSANDFRKKMAAMRAIRGIAKITMARATRNDLLHDSSAALLSQEDHLPNMEEITATLQDNHTAHVFAEAILVEVLNNKKPKSISHLKTTIENILASDSIYVRSSMVDKKTREYFETLYEALTELEQNQITSKNKKNSSTSLEQNTPGAHI
ncbi:MAG: hypothetical protein KDI11_06445 [Alphaproteobacteria bacterium]|nr:hypothetical protein [Alphaproteobacteria bacterium]